MRLSQTRKKRKFKMDSYITRVAFTVALLFLSVFSIESREVAFHITKLNKPFCSLEGVTLLTNGKVKRYLIKDSLCLSSVSSNVGTCHIKKVLKENSKTLSALGECRPITFKSNREIFIESHSRDRCYISGKSIEYISVRESPPERTLINRAINFRDENCSKEEKLFCFVISTYKSTPDFLKAYGRCSGIDKKEDLL